MGIFCIFIVSARYICVELDRRNLSIEEAKIIVWKEEFGISWSVNMVASTHQSPIQYKIEILHVHNMVSRCFRLHHTLTLYLIIFGSLVLFFSFYYFDGHGWPFTPPVNRISQC